ILDKKGDVDDIVSDIALLENGQVVREASLGEKESLIYNGLRIFHQEAGFAPLVELTGPGNVALAKMYILLNTQSMGDKSQFYLNGFPIPNSVYTANIRFYPDMIRRGKEITTAKYTLTNPSAVVTILQGTKRVTEKVIKPGEFIEFSGYRIKFGDIRHWNGFDIVNDRGANFVFAGSWVAIFGLTVMYLIPYKKVQVCIDEGGAGIKVMGVTNRSRKTFEEELAELREKLGGFNKAE
ncbi:MAG: cytochrome c biogenesis protein ResB, partial [Eubacteriales bacterium]